MTTMMMIYLARQNELFICELRRDDDANQEENIFYFNSATGTVPWMEIFVVLYLLTTCHVSPRTFDLIIICGPEFLQGGF